MRFFALFFSLCVFFNANTLVSNPYELNLEPKENLTFDDYVKIQEQLKTISVEHLLRQSYPQNSGYFEFSDFLSRISRGIKQTLISPEKGLLPIQRLEKIGNGSEMCIVSCAPYDKDYPSLLKSILDALRATGFNGYFLYQIGGFPNPTGIEMKYAGVPYSFKIFMMKEAQKLGFDKVMWIDSAMLPLNDPTPLFAWIDLAGSLYHGWSNPQYYRGAILPSTHQLLKNLTGTDVLNTRYICTRVFGLKMSSIEAQKLVKTYYQLVELGTPFLSCFPEEFVLTAIIGQPDYIGWSLSPYTDRLFYEAWWSSDADKRLNQIKQGGYFFFQRNH